MLPYGKRESGSEPVQTFNRRVSLTCVGVGRMGWIISPPSWSGVTVVVIGAGSMGGGTGRELHAASRLDIPKSARKMMTVNLDTLIFFPFSLGY
jgi:hypothetical protein